MQPRLNCGNCGQVTYLHPLYSPNCGDVLKCHWCSTRFVAHPCGHSESSGQALALQLLVSGISKSCPQCGIAYRVGDVIERFNPSLGKAVKEVALAAGVTVLVGTALRALAGGR